MRGIRSRLPEDYGPEKTRGRGSGRSGRGSGSTCDSKQRPKSISKLAPEGIERSIKSTSRARSMYSSVLKCMVFCSEDGRMVLPGDLGYNSFLKKIGPAQTRE